ncbi:hypothetical protein ABK905_13045 [Acerihabitans sp. KWT182]|uniref:Uncharacterized protein n=1 Tax=Acerihabitans sp. KWT182 TaxID=3157919 RepID=A0AAU7QF66_9GAMM
MAYPQMLDRIYLSTAAADASGTDATRMSSSLVSGTTTSSADATTNAQNSNVEANVTTNAISNAKGSSSSGSADSAAAETMVPLRAMAHKVNHTATQRQPSERAGGRSVV